MDAAQRYRKTRTGKKEREDFLLSRNCEPYPGKGKFRVRQLKGKGLGGEGHQINRKGKKGVWKREKARNKSYAATNWAKKKKGKAVDYRESIRGGEGKTLDDHEGGTNSSQAPKNKKPKDYRHQVSRKGVCWTSAGGSSGKTERHKKLSGMPKACSGANTKEGLKLGGLGYFPEEKGDCKPGQPARTNEREGPRQSMAEEEIPAEKDSPRPISEAKKSGKPANGEQKKDGGIEMLAFTRKPVSPDQGRGEGSGEGGQYMGLARQNAGETDRVGAAEKTRNKVEQIGGRTGKITLSERRIAVIGNGARTTPPRKREEKGKTCTEITLWAQQKPLPAKDQIT